MKFLFKRLFLVIWRISAYRQKICNSENKPYETLPGEWNVPPSVSLK